MSDPTRSKDARMYPRHPVNLWAVHLEGEARFYCYVRNLSLGGLFFDTKIPFPVGTPITLELEIPDSAVLLADAIIVHAAEGNGVQFRDLSSDGAGRIKSYLSAQ